jgi:protoporphyrinogen oxidase
MTAGNSSSLHVAVIGGGFCGLAAGYELVRRDVRVTVFERDAEIGGLAGSFQTNGTRLEKFYHHWFTSDEHVMTLINELDLQDHVIMRATRTGTYYANKLFRLSTPIDVLRFRALPMLDRLRLGMLALRARRVQNWQELEGLTAVEWLRQMGGDKVYEVVWEPLLRGKFGKYASEISAVWFWNKLKLRGGSRGKSRQEQLAYFRGGFAALADQIGSHITSKGGNILVNRSVEGLVVDGGTVRAVIIGAERVPVDAVIATPALPMIADLIQPHVAPPYVEKLRRINYLSNVCLVLELEHSLSDLYWINVNDPDFPFVGVIEHTNFEPPASYGRRHIVYLSKYLTEDSELFKMEDDELLEYTIPHLQRMFPAFERKSILAHHVWRARYSQPVVERNYSRLIPDTRSPLSNFLVASMAQIYPEDRGTNYAIRQGRKIAAEVEGLLKSSHQ